VRARRNRRNVRRLPAANITFSEGEARIADPRVIVGDNHRDDHAGRPTRWTFHRLSATVNGGDAEIAGSIRHQSFTTR